MRHLHNHMGYNVYQNIWGDYGTFNALTLIITTGLGIAYSLYLWCSFKPHLIFNGNSNIQSIRQKLMSIIQKHIWKVLAGNLFGIVIVFIALLAVVQKFVSGYLSVAYIIGAITTTLLSYVNVRILALTSVKTVFVSQQFNLNQKFEREKIVKKGSYLISCLSMSITLLVMFLLIASYSFFEQSLVRRQVVHCLLSFALGTISSSLMISSVGGFFAKGIDIATDTYGKLQNHFDEDDLKNLGSLYDAAGDIIGKGMGSVSRQTAEFVTSITIPIIICHFTTKSINGTSISPSQIYFPLLIASISILVQIIMSTLSIHLDIKNIGIRSLQLGVIIILILSYFGSVQTIKDRFIASFSGDVIASFTTIFVCIALGLIVGTLIAIQSQIFVSPNCKFFKDVYNSSTTGASTNIIQGLAIGYFAPILPTILIAAVFLFGYNILGFYGVSLIGLGISAVSPLVLNTINVTTILDCALCLNKQIALNNQTSIIKTNFMEVKYQQVYVRMFSIVLNVISSISLIYFCQFKYIASSLNDPIQFSGLLIGAIFPYIILSLSLRATASISSQLILAFRKIGSNLFPQNLNLISIWQTILFISPSLLTFILPIILKLLFKQTFLHTFLTGIILSSLQITISSFISGSIWSSVNKQIELQSIQTQNSTDQQIILKGSIIGDCIGDSLKDIGEPIINHLVISIALIITVISLPFYQQFF